MFVYLPSMRKCSTFRILLITLLLGFFLADISAQSKYWVSFADKPRCELSPQNILSERAIQRRIRNNIPVLTETDMPINLEYVSTIKGRVDSLGHSSKWLNGVSVWASADQASELKEIAWVKEVICMQMTDCPLMSKDEPELSTHHQAILQSQTEIMGAESFKQASLDGKGVLIAVFDVGFRGVDERKEFGHLLLNNRILHCHDFISNDDDVYAWGTHGTNVLSCIAGISDGKAIGLATGASFALARTERNLWETIGEEDSWLAAAEWADSLGVDVINSSLGYTNNRYFWKDLDGQHTLVSRAAQMAFEKGIVVVNATGNDGDTDWEYLGAPADAPGVLAVGGISPWTGIATSFSSFGPTADGRMKPNISAFGNVIACGPNGLHQTSGTSFASPLVAGFVACLLQYNPQLTAKEAFNLIQQSGHLYPYFDYVHGYGIPQADKVLKPNSAENNDEVVFDWNKGEPACFINLKQSAAEQEELEEGYPYHHLRDLIYWHAARTDGQILHYGVIEPEGTRGGILIKSKLEGANLIRIHYKGTTYLHEINL
jgi:serine protease AprX